MFITSCAVSVCLAVFFSVFLFCNTNLHSFNLTKLCLYHRIFILLHYLISKTLFNRSLALKIRYGICRRLTQHVVFPNTSCLPVITFMKQKKNQQPRISHKKLMLIYMCIFFFVSLYLYYEIFIA